jgi:hypothetical protein
MSFSENIMYSPSLDQALHGALVVAILLGSMIIFRPLLTGIGRALVLVFRQRILARKELARRRSLHEVRAIASRG